MNDGGACQNKWKHLLKYLVPALNQIRSMDYGYVNNTSEQIDDILHYVQKVSQRMYK